MAKSVKKKTTVKNKKINVPKEKVAVTKEKCWCGLRSFGILILSSFGIATFIQGIFLQIRGYGWFYGFLAYILALMAFGIAKMMRNRMLQCSCFNRP